MLIQSWLIKYIGMKMRIVNRCFKLEQFVCSELKCVPIYFTLGYIYLQSRYTCVYIQSGWHDDDR